MKQLTLSVPVVWVCLTASLVEAQGAPHMPTLHDSVRWGDAL